MSKALFQILYNPSSLSSVQSEQMSFSDDFLNSSIKSEDPALLIAGLTMETLDEKSCHARLIQLKRALSLPLAPEGRLELIKSFNELIIKLSASHTAAMDVFQCTVQLIMQFKDHIEMRPQTEGRLHRSEWVELEKSICHLSTWESQLDYFWANLH